MKMGLYGCSGRGIWRPLIIGKLQSGRMGKRPRYSDEQLQSILEINETLPPPLDPSLRHYPRPATMAPSLFLLDFTLVILPQVSLPCLPSPPNLVELPLALLRLTVPSPTLRSNVPINDYVKRAPPYLFRPLPRLLPPLTPIRIPVPQQSITTLHRFRTMMTMPYRHYPRSLTLPPTHCRRSLLIQPLLLSLNSDSLLRHNPLETPHLDSIQLV